jgi:glucoamylase
MEGFATSTKLLPEQVWALPDLPKAHMKFGCPTGAAMPLAWAHAEYMQLVRSAADGQIFGLISDVSDRYRNRCKVSSLEIWKFNRQVRSVRACEILRIQAGSPFRLRWTLDEWQQFQDTDSTPIGTGHSYVDIHVLPEQRALIRFTFFWTTNARWEGRNFQVNVNVNAKPRCENSIQLGSESQVNVSNGSASIPMLSVKT